MDFSNDRKAAIKKLKSFVLPQKVEEFEDFRDKIEKKFGSDFLPNHVEKNEHTYGGVKCDILVPEIYSSNKVMYYVHGGSFVGGSRFSYGPFCASLANTCLCKVVIPEFRLPPAYCYPAGIEDLHESFRSLVIEQEVSIRLRDKESKKINSGAPEIYLCADTSGAGLLFAMVSMLDEKYLNLIKGIILISPWLDFTPGSEIYKNRKNRDEIFSQDDLRRSALFYTYESNLLNAKVSTLNFDEDILKTFPPVYIQVAENELIFPQVKKFENLLEINGVNCDVEIFNKMIPNFQMADDCIFESHLAVEKIGAYINKKIEDEKEIKYRGKILKKNHIGDN